MPWSGPCFTLCCNICFNFTLCMHPNEFFGTLGGFGGEVGHAIQSCVEAFAGQGCILTCLPTCLLLACMYVWLCPFGQNEVNAVWAQKTHG